MPQTPTPEPQPSNVVQFPARTPDLRWKPQTAIGLMHKIRYTALELGCFDPADPDCTNKLAASKHRSTALMLLLYNDAMQLAGKELERETASAAVAAKKHAKKRKR